MVTERQQQIDAFFNDYSDTFNRSLTGSMPDAAHTAALFSNCFVAASPLGVNCGQNDAAFRQVMKKGYAFYKSIGITSMDIIAKDITTLDDFHTMARIRWRSKFTRKDGQQGSLEFQNIYFVQTRNDEHKVFAYITGDEEAALKDMDLI